MTVAMRMLASTILHLVVCVYAAAAENDRPIIGVLTQPMGVELAASDGLELAASASNRGSFRDKRTYIAASYVKFAESAGARVVPLHFDASDAELTELFRSINGIIFPGGGSNIKSKPGNRFRAAGQLLYDLALKSNDAGDPFPIHGTCLGFQMLSLIAAESDDGVLCAGCYTTEGTPLPLSLTAGANTSRLLSAMPSSLKTALMTLNITENSHHTGIEPKTFKDNPKLADFFRVLSTNVDPRNNKPFVSTIEARRYPISATQWHPEKNNFEWGKIGKLGYAAIPHSHEAVALSQYIANDFVNRARQSSHRFASEQAEKQALIYNFHAVEDPQGYFSQIYVWDRPEQSRSSVIV